MEAPEETVAVAPTRIFIEDHIGKRIGVSVNNELRYYTLKRVDVGRRGNLLLSLVVPVLNPE